MLKKNEKVSDKIYKILLYISWSFILIISVGDLFFVPLRSIVWFGSLIILFALHKKYHYIPDKIHLMLVFIAIANIAGEILYKLFYEYHFYDKILHLINPLMIATFLFFAYRKKISNEEFLVMFCIFAALSVSTVWEIYEWVSDQFFGTYLQGVYSIKSGYLLRVGLNMTLDKMTDTMLDLLVDIASLLIFTIGYLINKKISGKKSK